LARGIREKFCGKLWTSVEKEKEVEEVEEVKAVEEKARWAESREGEVR
jgi:hypothetical protein